MNRYVVIDLETTGHSPEVDDQIIEIGIVVIENEQIVDTYTTLIDPQRSIPEFITHLTGISHATIKGAPYFSDVAKKIVDYCSNSYFIAHNVPFDLGFLNEALKQTGISPLENDIIDTVELSRMLLPKADGFKLNELASFLNISHDDPHRALSDAYVTAKLFIYLKKKLASLPYETLKQLMMLEHLFDSDLSPLLNELSSQNAFKELPQHMTTYEGLAVCQLGNDKLINQEITKSFGELIDDVYLGESSWQHHLPTYEYRQGQHQMSEYIYDAFQAEQHALIEAGTGTGKSLAYLLPTIYESVANNERMVISTHTTHLQTQLLEESLDMLQQRIDFPFRVALLKGKQHYISLERFQRSLNDDESNYDIALTKAILLIWLTETVTGDIDEIRLPASGYKYFRSISHQADRHIYSGPIPTHLSYYVQAKEKAQNAHLVIVNHALLCTDIKNDYEILPTYNKAIIDEAHHLPEVFAKTYGLHMSFLTIHHFLTDLNVANAENKWIQTMVEKYDSFTNIKSHLSTWDDVLTDALIEVDDFFRRLYRFVKQNNRFKGSYNDIGRLQLRLAKQHVESEIWELIEQLAARVIMHLNDLMEILTQVNSEAIDTVDCDDLQAHMDQIDTFIEHLNQLFINCDLQQDVIWFEIDRAGAENIVYIYSEPIEGATRLSESFFDKKQSIILTSATLTVRQSFSFIKKKLGLMKDTCKTYHLSSPFPFNEQVQILVPNDFPHINEQAEEFVYATCEAIISLAKITEGRMLVLFTSYDMLRSAHRILQETLNINKYTLIAQGISSGSRSRLKRSFQTYKNAILLGTSSFWEGIDIPGEDLSALMIVRLPFQPPNDPVYEAKATTLQQDKKNPFFELALPNAVIRFKQGFGRLIRSVNDRGIVFICDSRIMTAKYGHFFIRSIPDVPITYDSTSTLIKAANKWI